MFVKKCRFVVGEMVRVKGRVSQCGNRFVVLHDVVHTKEGGERRNPRPVESAATARFHQFSSLFHQNNDKITVASPSRTRGHWFGDFWRWQTHVKSPCRLLVDASRISLQSDM